MHGLGCGLLLPLIFSIPSQWIRKHRGLATGIVVAGASLGGGVPSLLVQVRFNPNAIFNHKLMAYLRKCSRALAFTKQS